MKVTAWKATLLLLAIGQAGCAGFARPGPCPAAVTIDLAVGPASVEYPNKTTDPVPGFKRSCPFKINVDWSAAGAGQTLTLSDFVAVSYKAKAKKWQDPESRKINGVDDSVTLDMTKAEWGPYTLPSSKKVGPPRLILYTLELKTKNGTVVKFDPPWSEKKR